MLNCSTLKKNGIEHRVDFLGDGISSVMRIIANLIITDNNSKPLVIDEPELSLHPNAKRRLARLLYDYSLERQIIICTHSPEMIEWEYILGGAKVNRIVKNNGKSSIFHLREPAVYDGIFNGKDWQKPHYFGMAAKEIFFEDNILFLEGQEDMSLLMKDGCLANNVNIFGYGVGSYTMFDTCLTMAKDLGIEKAVALFDHGNSEQETLEKLKRKHPTYKFFMWNKEDIRDKVDLSTGAIIKEGYFDRHGNKKSANELDDYNEKITMINEYLK